MQKQTHNSSQPPLPDTSSYIGFTRIPGKVVNPAIIPMFPGRYAREGEPVTPVMPPTPATPSPTQYPSRRELPLVW